MAKLQTIQELSNRNAVIVKYKQDFIFQVCPVAVTWCALQPFHTAIFLFPFHFPKPVHQELPSLCNLKALYTQAVITDCPEMSRIKLKFHHSKRLALNE